jgi:phosphoribosylamine--glycine ligase/phosphoribosylaminoimidazole synthetase
MHVAIVGSGGREHALAWSCEQSGHQVSVVPTLDDAFHSNQPVDLVIPGPEHVLVAGAADRCRERQIPCFGPVAALTRWESSKSWARTMADQLGIPGPASAHFDADQPGQIDAAIAWWQERGHQVVIKLDGLAAGKGVTVPTDDDETIAAIRSTTGKFLLEERLNGPEISLLALCDGTRAVALPLAQDHKRIGEGDTGPNTGGMGAYAPAPAALLGDVSVDDLLTRFINPVLQWCASQNTPYIGVLYAGLMITSDGPRLIEYNVRFGDPETQAILPLVDADLAEIALSATQGNLDPTDLRIRRGASCTVVMAAPGYPTEVAVGGSVEIPADLGPDTYWFGAGLAGDQNSGYAITGGRVLSVTAVGADLGAARTQAYRGVSQIHGDGLQYRRDIAWQAPAIGLGSYASAGVNIDEGHRALAQMKSAVERTHGPEVLRGLGSFGGAWSAKRLTAMDHPVLVASTDGVGTKVELALQTRRLSGVGFDLVNHCVNDVLVQGAAPLFFLDYVAASQLVAEDVAEIVAAMAEACEANRCALLGGETAEMPGVYHPGTMDLAGTLVGVVEHARLLPRDDLAAGDLLIGIGSSGPHTNGYSLLRKIFSWIPLETIPDGMDVSLADALLAPHRSYLDLLSPALDSATIKGLAHITGGGIPENLNRVLPPHLDAEVRLGSWPLPPLFALVKRLAVSMGTVELYTALNMGIGMIAVCAPHDLATVQNLIDEPTWVIGELVSHDSGVHSRAISDPPRVHLI